MMFSLSDSKEIGGEKEQVTKAAKIEKRLRQS
jgi:hypothetical protein